MIELKVGEYYEYKEGCYHYYFKVQNKRESWESGITGKYYPLTYDCIVVKDLTTCDGFNWSGGTFVIDENDLHHPNVKITKVPKHEVPLLILECDNE